MTLEPFLRTRSPTFKRGLLMDFLRSASTRPVHPGVAAAMPAGALDPRCVAVPSIPAPSAAAKREARGIAAPGHPKALPRVEPWPDLRACHRTANHLRM